MNDIIKNIEAAQLKESVPEFGVGVEKTWPLHSPNVDRIEVVRKGKVRRAKLSYLKNRIGKAAKVKEIVR